MMHKMLNLPEPPETSVPHPEMINFSPLRIVRSADGRHIGLLNRLHLSLRPSFNRTMSCLRGFAENSGCGMTFWTDEPGSTSSVWVRKATTISLGFKNSNVWVSPTVGFSLKNKTSYENVVSFFFFLLTKRSLWHHKLQMS